MPRRATKGRDLVETSLLYVGILAFTLYPLGFIALGIEMLRDPFFPYYDFDTVWNAVSLVPQTVVIGTGVRLLYLSLISTALGVGIWYVYNRDGLLALPNGDAQVIRYRDCPGFSR